MTDRPYGPSRVVVSLPYHGGAGGTCGTVPVGMVIPPVIPHAHVLNSHDGAPQGRQLVLGMGLASWAPR